MSKRRRRSRRDVVSNDPKVRGSLVTGAVGLGVAALAATDLSAATFNVTNLNDSGAGSLRQAIEDANAAAGADTITFQSGLTGTITLTSGDLEIADSVDIQGPGRSVISVSGANSSGVFYIYSSSAEIDVTISGLTVRDGAAEIGAGIYVFDENLTLDDVLVTQNIASGGDLNGIGAGLFGTGDDFDLTITDSSISANTAGGSGGGIYIADTGGPVLIENSIISDNIAGCCGGGIFFYDPDYAVTIRDTTISGNTAQSVGGGIYLYDTDGGPFTIERSTISGNTGDAGGGMFAFKPDHPVNIVNSTFSGNDATIGPGGGIYFYNAANGLTLDFVTVAENEAFAGGGIAVANYEAVITNSIIGDNIAYTSYADLAGSFDVSYSLVETPSTADIDDLGNNIFNTDPMLEPLAANGGPTRTQRPQIGSPVIDEADPATTLATDQRGQPREYPVLPDMGAVEVVGGVIQFSPETYNVDEDAGTVSLTLVRDIGPDPAEIDIDTANISATAGNDYTALNTTVAFAADELSVNVNVPILDDNLEEGAEQFTATLSNPSDGATLGPAVEATVTINDIEPGLLAFSSPTYTVDEDAGMVTITVNRTGGSTEAVSVTYSTTAGSAGAGDYTTTNGTLNFAVGQTVATFDVPILDDALVEGNESFTVTLSAPTNGATLSEPSTATVTITDVEAGTLAFSAATYSVSESAGLITVTVNRTGGSTEAVSVNYATTSGSATAGSDFTTTNGTLNFAIGQTVATFDVPILDDNSVEGNEDFTVTLSGATNGATIGSPNPATITINDIEGGALAFTAGNYDVNENAGTVTITVTRGAGATEPVTVDYATSPGTAGSGDFSGTSGTLNFAANQTSATFDVTIVDDNLVEGNETFNVTLSNATGGATIGSPNPATVTIIDVEAGTLAFSSATYNVNENGGAIEITVNRTGGSTEAVSVNYTTNSSTASAGSDFTTTNGTLNFAAGQTSASFNVPILDDNFVEGNEVFNVTLSGPTNGATIGSPNPAAVTITDVEAGTFSFSSATYNVDENMGTLNVTVNRSSGTTEAAAVNYATASGSATAGSDFTTAGGTLNFSAGQTSATFAVSILDDALVEGSESFTVTLSAPTNGATIGSPNPATITINDIEAGTAQFTVSDVTVNESDGTVTLTVTRTGGSSGSITVNFATSDGSATGGSDYVPGSGSLTFDPGDTTPKNIVIPILVDDAPEPDENFTVTLTGSEVGAPNTVTVTIAAHTGVAVPALDGLGKMLLILGAALAGLFAAGRNRLWSFLLIFAMVAAAAPPAFAQAKSPRETRRARKETKEGKIRGTIASITAAEESINITFEDGQSVSVPRSKIRVMDHRGGQRIAATASVLSTGLEVVVRQAKKHVLVKILR